MSPIPTHDHHSHANGTCPVVGSSHDYCPPQPGDKRSPCPAMNTLANHGFLPRDGRHITPPKLFHALRQGFHLSTFFALFFAISGWVGLGQYRNVSLWDFSRHNCVEHDASLFHDDAGDEDDYAPTTINHALLETTLRQGGRYVPGRMTLEDVANIRAKREAGLGKPFPWLRAEFSRGEMAVVIAVFGGKNADKDGVDIEMLRHWAGQERFPEGWKPDHTQGAFQVASMMGVIRRRMDAIKQGRIPNILDDESAPPPTDEKVDPHGI